MACTEPSLHLGISQVQVTLEERSSVVEEPRYLLICHFLDPLEEKAKKLQSLAENVGKNGVSSDDPDAINKLSEKLEKLQKQQELYRAINKALRKADKSGDDAPLKALGLSDQTIAELKQPDFAGRRGIPSYVLTNNRSNMRRIRQRIEELKATAEDQTSSEQHGEILIVDNVEENRVQIFFPDKPDQQMRARLKGYGFRWSPTAGAWQRYRSNAGLYWARQCCGAVTDD